MKAKHFALTLVISLLAVIALHRFVFAQAMSVNDAATRGLFGKDTLTVVIMNFKDYTGDPSLVGMQVAIPNEIARRIHTQTGMTVKRVVEMPPQKSSENDKTEVGFGGFSIKLNLKKIVQWLKGKPIVLAVEGEYSKVGDNLTITARRIDPKEETQIGDDVVVSGNPATAPYLMEEEAQKLLSSWPLPNVNLGSLPSIPDIKAPDMKANLASWDLSSKAASAIGGQKFGASDLKGIKVSDFKVEKFFGDTKPSKQIDVKIQMEKKNYKIGEMAHIDVVSNTDGYLTLFDLASSGNVHVIFPNQWQTNNFIRKDTPIRVPDTGETDYLQVSGPKGVNKVVAILTVEPSALTLPDLSRGFGEVTYRDLKVIPKTLKSTTYGFGETVFNIE